jgi:hypothetical protein
MKQQLLRTSDKLTQTATYLKKNGLSTWDLAEEWDSPTPTFSAENYYQTAADVENIKTPLKETMFLDRYEQLLVQNWTNLADFSEFVTFLFDQPAPNREALQHAEHNKLKGRRNQPKWLVSCTCSALNMTAEYLKTPKVTQAWKLAKATKYSQQYETYMTLMFTYSVQLTEFIADIQKNKQPRTTLCQEPYCKDFVTVIRRGRCPSCYAWIRRWQIKNDEQIPPPVPKHIIDHRYKIRNK